MTKGIEQEIESLQEHFEKVRAEISRVIVGNEDVIANVMTCLLARGHVLLEGIPGVGKTKLVQTMADAMHLDFSRIQFTPDLMPGDIVGTNIVRENEQGKKSFEFQKGPVFANVVLADEINRATPKTQSALLEAMQENSVSAGGNTYSLDQPFFVLATQNPIEMEGTYPLPEAQMDRFLFKLRLEFPTVQELHTIVDRTTKAEEPVVDRVLDKDQIIRMRETVRSIPISNGVQDYAVKVNLATHPEQSNSDEMIKKYVRFGASPRGVQSLILGAKVRAILAGRVYVASEDIRSVILPALRHRVLLNFEAEVERIDTDTILKRIIEIVPEPTE